MARLRKPQAAAPTPEAQSPYTQRELDQMRPIYMVQVPRLMLTLDLCLRDLAKVLRWLNEMATTQMRLRILYEHTEKRHAQTVARLHRRLRKRG